ECRLEVAALRVPCRGQVDRADEQSLIYGAGREETVDLGVDAARRRGLRWSRPHEIDRELAPPRVRELADAPLEAAREERGPVWHTRQENADLTGVKALDQRGKGPCLLGIVEVGGNDLEVDLQVSTHQSL